MTFFRKTGFFSFPAKKDKGTKIVVPKKLGRSFAVVVVVVVVVVCTLAHPFPSSGPFVAFGHSKKFCRWRPSKSKSKKILLKAFFVSKALEVEGLLSKKSATKLLEASD